MINDNIRPIDPTGFRFPTETEMAIDETLKLCGISGEDASMIAMEVLKKLGKSDETSACCRCLAEERSTGMKNEVYRLTLDHFIDYGGERIRLEEPLVVQMIYDRSQAPSAVCLNRMFEMMRDEVLKRATEGERE